MEIWEDSTIGSDHYPVLCKIYVGIDERVEEREAKWIFTKAKWEKKLSIYVRWKVVK